jgi:hypothetical protein
MTLRREFRLATFSERTAQGFIRFACDWFGEKAGGGRVGESLSPWGLISRPRDPDLSPDGEPTGGAGILLDYDGDQPFFTPTQDPRYASLIPDPKKGGAVLYAVTGTPRAVSLVLDGDTGTATLTVPVGASGSTTLVVDGSNGDVAITHQSGTKVTVKSEILLGESATLHAAIAEIVKSNFDTLSAAFAAWVPVPQDGGAALKAVMAAVSYQDPAATKVKIQ